ncbi:MAG: aminotransferase class III-fold pyridoxal phosphate-dependent enzyme, partial [Candidatus Bathyarchaeia archaeon]
MELRNRYVPRGIRHVVDIFVAEAEGAIIKDVDGNVYIDFVGGFAALNIGHRRPEVLAAIAEQSKKYLHVAFQVTPYEPYIIAARKLVEVTPGNFEKKVMFTNSGTEAVENAVKIVKSFTGRGGLIHFHNSFHGRSL